ncbi:type VI secretion system tube protein Hcp, partial [Enterobacter hormaechei]|uniref:type VI secretion system tube protein Hcp n=1 Tax=Enterobacter hormaechei TaxID=158836 RepID=UPI00192CEE6C
VAASARNNLKIRISLRRVSILRGEDQRTLKSATIKMYQINEAGFEQEYFNIFLENVKITSITPDLYPGANTGTHLETVLIRYEKITWKHCDGNVIYSDTWNERATY